MERNTEKSLTEIIHELKTNPEAPVPLLINEIGVRLLEDSDESVMAEKYLVAMLKSSCHFEQMMGLFYLLVYENELTKEAYESLSHYLSDLEHKSVVNATMDKVGEYLAIHPKSIC